MRTPNQGSMSNKVLTIACFGNPHTGKKRLSRRLLGLPETADPFAHPYSGTIRRTLGDGEIDVSYHLMEFGSVGGGDLSLSLDSPGVDRQIEVLARLDGAIFLLDTRLQLYEQDRARLEHTQASIGAAGVDPERVPILFAVARTGLRQRYPHTLPALEEMWGTEERPLMSFDPFSGEGTFEVLDAAISASLHVRTGNVRRAAPAKTVSCSPQVDGTQFFARHYPYLRRAVTESEWGSVTAHLLTAWRATKSEDLASLLEGVSYAHRSTRPEHVSHDWWVATCTRRRPEDLPALLDSLALWERSPTVSLERHVSQVVERLEGLCWWEEDPRATPRLGSFFADLGRYRRATVQSGLCRVLRRHGDPRSLQVYERYLQDLCSVREPLEYRNPQLGALVSWTLYESRPGSGANVSGRLLVPTDQQDAWQSLVERIRRPLPRPEDMEAIAADPKNDDLRRELAEGMRDRGDPRGEFIRLQLKKATGSLSPDEHEREQALKRTYAWDWLGPLADVVDVENSVFEKGYPVKLTVWTPNTRALADVVGKPEWATVREIRWGGDPCWEEEKPDAELVEHPIMRSLEKVTTKMPEDPAELEALRRVAWAR